jgi:hypothetical protein
MMQEEWENVIKVKKIVEDHWNIQNVGILELAQDIWHTRGRVDDTIPKSNYTGKLFILGNDCFLK